jgi:uncharacterized protein (TIGR01777 family)
MKIVLAGGSGFLGRALAGRLARDRHDIWILSRTAGSDPAAHRVRWTPDGTVGAWASVIDGADAVVNLAGAGLEDKRWTPARKHELVTSRVDSSRSLVAAVAAARARPSVFIQNTGVGYYGFSHGDEPLGEGSAPGNDFLARLCVDWEAAVTPVAALGCRLVVLRTGVVLARDGGALPKMMLPFRFFAGGPMGSGRQYLSWIHIDDWMAMVTWAITSSTLTGAVNATAPVPVTSRELARAIGAAMHRPSLVPAPAFALRIIVGEMADAALLGGQRVLPRRAIESGFAFAHPEVHDALESLLTSR